MKDGFSKNVADVFMLIFVTSKFMPRRSRARFVQEETDGFAKMLIAMRAIEDRAPAPVVIPIVQDVPPHLRPLLREGLHDADRMWIDATLAAGAAG